MPTTEDRPLDFRSDTLTKPTAEMRAAMAAAPVGDDVFDEDPTVHALQERVADLLGKEAALYVPSGTMSNQVAVRVHCSPGDEFLCETTCHINRYEQAAHTQLSGVAAHAIEGEHGRLTLKQFQNAVRPDDNHCARTRMVTLENTHNAGGGTIQRYEMVESLGAWARETGLRTHLDGARLLNAVVATGIPAADWAQHFDTVSICFSKGLGAPVGSALAGTRELIRRARRQRTPFGGGMRQSGVIAAGALYALENHVERLAEDHALAKRLGEAISQIDGLSLGTPTVETNMVMFEIDPRLASAAVFAERLSEAGLKMFDVGPKRIRAVVHLDLPPDAAERAAEILRKTLESLRKAPAAVSG